MQRGDYDVAVVGAGVCGCAIARELARLDCRVVVLDREADVGCGTSKANSAIVHAGFDAPVGSLMARLNVEGNRLMYPLCEELGVACEQVGSLVVCTSEETRGGLDDLLARGRANGVPGLRIVGRDELRAMEPNVSDAAVAALWAPTGGIVDVLSLVAALAESAADNGVEFSLGTLVCGVRALPEGGFAVDTDQGSVRARVVVNAAGVYAGEVHAMACPDEVPIVPRKGEYLLLDTTAGSHVRHTVFCLPTKMGKGVLVTPTTHGNLLVGPTATDVDDPRATDTTPAGLAEVAERASVAVRDVPLREVITSFAGLRAHRPEHEFLIGESLAVPGFVDCAGIESPGLTSAPAIGVMVAAIVRGILGCAERPAGAFRPGRRPIPDLDHVSRERWQDLVEHDGAYGRVVCRCRHVSEAQIVDAIRRPVGARTLDGVKRRTGAMMGRCQGGFCTPKIMALLAREVAGLDLSDVSKSGPGSELVVGFDKEPEGGDAE